jgi:hypothetical protein
MVVRLPLAAGGLVFAAFVAACSGTSTSAPQGPAPAATTAPPSDPGAPEAPPGITPPATTAPPATPPAAPPFTPSAADGTASHVACTSSFGNALTVDHGRLDGYLVSIVPANTHQCNGDSSHLHLQVKANDAVYDVAVNLDALEAELDAPLPGTPWTEGWHAAAPLDYAKDLNLHAPVFAASSATAQRTHLEAILANVNHIVIYATAYDPTGAHLVHREGSDRDGAIILDPLAPTPHVVAFRFTQDTF